MLVEDEEVNDGVMLGDNITEGGKNPKVRSDEFVYKVVELTVELFLEILLLENSQLQLAKHFIFEEQVDENVIALVVKSVFYFYYFQEIRVGFLNFV